MFFLCFNLKICEKFYLMPPVAEMPVCTFSEQLFESNFSPHNIDKVSEVHRKSCAE